MPACLPRLTPPTKLPVGILAACGEDVKAKTEAAGGEISFTAGYALLHSAASSSPNPAAAADGQRVWLDGELVLDNWVMQSPTRAGGEGGPRAVPRQGDGVACDDEHQGRRSE